MNFYIKKIGLLFLLVLFFGLFGFVGCNFFVEISEKEEILVILPQWPPSLAYGMESEKKSIGFQNQEKYPELSRWEVTVCTCEKKDLFYSRKKSFKLTVNKNEPFCVIARPVTLAKKGTESYETAFFYPAGGIYPYSKEIDAKVFLKWEDGFMARTFEKIILGGKESGKSCETVGNFVKNFNWKKASECVEEKITKSVLNDSEAVFNPWLIDSQKMLASLSNGKFSQSSLNLSGSFDFDLNEMFASSENENEIKNQTMSGKLDEIEGSQKCEPFASEKTTFLLSAFVVENEYLRTKKKIKVKKGYKSYLYDGKMNVIVLENFSGKNVSKQNVFLPIYFERL